MRNIKNIVIHCTATQPTASVTGIQNYWRNTLKWKQPGYHKIIKADGEIITLLPDNEISNGVAGYNSISLHVSYIGGIDKQGIAKDTRTPEQIASMIKVVSEWLCKYPNARILGHRDFPGVSKACPSFSAKDWWNNIGKPKF